MWVVAMTMSLRQVFSALGLGKSVSLRNDVLGFTEARRFNNTRPRPDFSVADFVHGLRRAHFHVHLIIAGSDLLTANDRRTIDYAVFRLRDTYFRSGIGVGRVTRDPRTAANSGGHATVTSSADIDSTGHDLTADGDFVPVVIPANMTVTTTTPAGTVEVTVGRSPVRGPCSPRKETGMNSAVVDIEGEEMGRTLAHEIGHYLGADHPKTSGTDLMTPTIDAGADPFNAVNIVDADRFTMREHCTIHNAIPGI
jgi:Metallo-peptidase family M12B Reprolysin-like